MFHRKYLRIENFEIEFKFLFWTYLRKEYWSKIAIECIWFESRFPNNLNSKIIFYVKLLPEDISGKNPGTNDEDQAKAVSKFSHKDKIYYSKLKNLIWSGKPYLLLSNSDSKPKNFFDAIPISSVLKKIPEKCPKLVKFQQNVSLQPNSLVYDIHRDSLIDQNSNIA